MTTDNLLEWRDEFPILSRCNYLISNSLGAMPRGVYDSLHYYGRYLGGAGRFGLGHGLVRIASDSWQQDRAADGRYSEHGAGASERQHRQ